MSLIARFTLLMTMSAGVFIAGCGGANTTPAATGDSNTVQQAASTVPKTPTVVGITSAPLRQQNLIDWPIKQGAELKPQALSGKLGKDVASFSLAADGDVIVMASSGNIGEVVTYDVDTHAEKMLRDPYGQPTDVAVGKQGDFYALDGYAHVAVFKHGSSQTSELSCSATYASSTIAVDNESDVFLNGEASKPAGTEIFEFPAGSQTCKELHLHVRAATAIGVDPKTDDLIVLENPHPGSGEVLMMIYPKPYNPHTAEQHVLHVTTGAYRLRLDATSTHIFYEDFFHGINKPLIDQAQYPSGKFEGHYEDGRHRYEYWVTGFTTIPNTLPN